MANIDPTGTYDEDTGLLTPLALSVVTALRSSPPDRVKLAAISLAVGMNTKRMGGQR